MRTLFGVFVVGFIVLGLYAVQPWKWLAPAPKGTVPVEVAGEADELPSRADEALASPDLADAMRSDSGGAVGGAGLSDGAAAGATAGGSPTGLHDGHVPGQGPGQAQANPIPTTPGAPRLDTFDVIPSERSVGVDGVPVFDGEFPLKGDGTQNAPYEITWEYLTSVERTYDPSIGRRQIPDRITMLGGKYVRISGHIAFPLFDNRPNELLIMLNQWDGCCIGVPPTPYDAIEVRLASPVTGEARYATYATVTGKLGVEPYVVMSSDGKMGFLLGIYVLDGASLSGSEFGGEGF